MNGTPKGMNVAQCTPKGGMKCTHIMTHPKVQMFRTTLNNIRMCTPKGIIGVPYTHKHCV